MQSDKAQRDQAQLLILLRVFISGGNGGDATNSNGGTAGAGAGGVGISGQDMAIINDGKIAGGMDFNQQVRALAVQFTGGSNTLEIHAGSSIYGVVEGGAGDDTLILGGSKDATFSVADVGDLAQYQHIDHFVKDGSSTWTLENTTSAVTPWLLKGGVLQIAADDNLGDSTSSLSFDGGTLRILGDLDLAGSRPVALLGNGGTLDLQQYAMTLSQGISGNGSLTKRGSGMLNLSGNSTYTGPTTLAEGGMNITGSLISMLEAQSGTEVYGTGSVGGLTLDAGSTLTVGDADASRQGNAPASFTVSHDVINNGNIHLSRSATSVGNRQRWRTGRAYQLRH